MGRTGDKLRAETNEAASQGHYNEILREYWRRRKGHAAYAHQGLVYAVGEHTPPIRLLDPETGHLITEMTAKQFRARKRPQSSLPFREKRS